LSTLTLYCCGIDYDLLLSDISANNNSNNIKRENDIFFSDLNSGLFKQEEGTEYNPHPRPKIVQWGPHDGQQATTIISVVLQYHLDTSSEEMLPTMKLGFGSIVVETAHQQHRLGNQSDSIWITLAAQAPLFSDTQCSTTNVPISICLFDSQDPDLAIDHWEIGTFTFREIQIGNCQWN
jgi:hypothetical protein